MKEQRNVKNAACAFAETAESTEHEPESTMSEPGPSPGRIATPPSFGGPSSGTMRRVLLVALFAVAFGYLEAAIVVYLRAIYDPVRAAVHPEKPADSLLPLIPLEALRDAGPEYVRLLGVELGREVCTMVMLAALASLATQRRGEWMAMFMIPFGIWDIAYYVGLKAMIGWPPSILTWDILFLIPVPWLGPVLAPVIVAASMIAAGALLLHAAAAGWPLQARWYHWAGIVAGGLMIIGNFCRGYAQGAQGEMPPPFNWVIFGLGEMIGLAAFAHAMISTRLGSVRVPV